MFCSLSAVFLLAANSQSPNQVAYVALDMVATDKLHPDELKLKNLDEESPKVNLSNLCHNVVISSRVTWMMSSAVWAGAEGAGSPPGWRGAAGGRSGELLLPE